MGDLAESYTNCDDTAISIENSLGEISDVSGDTADVSKKLDNIVDNIVDNIADNIVDSLDNNITSH